MKRALGSIFLIGFMIAFCLCYVVVVSWVAEIIDRATSDDFLSPVPEEIIFEDIEDKRAFNQ